MHRTDSTSRSGFSRLDLIVVVILGLTLLGLILVFLPRQRERGLRVQCMNNLRRLGEGVQSFHKGHDALPPARIADGYATWAVLLAPHVSRENPLEGWDMRKRFVEQEDQVRRALIAVFFCPARHRTTHVGDDGALGDYAAVAGNGDPEFPWTGPNANGPMILGEVTRQQDGLILEWRGRVVLHALKRGLSYTLIVGDKHVPSDGFGHLHSGDGSLYDGRHPASFSRVAGSGFGLARGPTAPMNDNFGSSHPGICQFLVADGSVRAFDTAVDPLLLGRLTTRE